MASIQPAITTGRLTRRFNATSNLSRWSRRSFTKPAQAPRTSIDIKHIRENPDLHSKNCIDRNYGFLAGNPLKIIELFNAWKKEERVVSILKQQSRSLQSKLTQGKTHIGPASSPSIPANRDVLEEARLIKGELQESESRRNKLANDIQVLAEVLPNLTGDASPIGIEPRLVGYILNNEVNIDLTNDVHGVSAVLQRLPKSHVEIGHELNILDLASAGTISGWGWYYLKNEAALLEQALVQYALSVALKHGFNPVSPPSMVYSHISSACGYQPRDQGGEQQIYQIQREDSDAEGGRPGLSLAGTAEIPFAGMLANSEIREDQLPLRLVGSSRCYRAEAGSRGVDTKGLYRVHEFTKVEMFGWTMPDEKCSAATELFESMLKVQMEILTALGLFCRVLEQPSADLGASSVRKQDIEAFFPSRADRNGGWGEITSTSICTDYQTRRLATRVRSASSPSLLFPYTVNGTALAVPRIVAALLETHWDDQKKIVRIPKALWPWMHGNQIIGANLPT